MNVPLALVWTMLTGTISAMVLAFSWITSEHAALSSSFVAAADFDKFSVEIYYEQYYNNLERLEVAKEKHRPTTQVNEIRRRLERLKAKICKIEPDWERCKPVDNSRPP